MSIAVANNQSVFQRRSENLSFVFQEILTAVMRLRTNRQSVSDARKFRTEMQKCIELAEKEARALGYSSQAVRLAFFAVIAFVDESVLNQRMEMFSDWVGNPLQKEHFGSFDAGNVFFQNVDRLLGDSTLPLAETDSARLADLLEVHQLCLLLGYRGRYGDTAQSALRVVIEATGDKIRRIRGAAQDLSPAWKLPQQETLPSQSDPWARRLLFTFAGCLAVTLLLFFGFNLSLSSGISTLKTFAAEPGK